MVKGIDIAKNNTHHFFKGINLDILIVIIFIVIPLAFYDLIRRVNHNILKQTEEIKKLREDLNKHK